MYMLLWLVFGVTDTDRERQSPLRSGKGSGGLHGGQKHVGVQRVVKEVAESQVPKPRLRGFGGGDETEGRTVSQVKRINPFQLLAKGETHHLHPGHGKQLDQPLSECSLSSDPLVTGDQRNHRG